MHGSRVRQGNTARGMTMRKACRGQRQGGGDCVLGRQGRRGRGGEEGKRGCAAGVAAS